MDLARFTDWEARGVLDVRHDLACLDEGGFWAVVVTFEGQATCVRFADVRPTTRMPWAAPCVDWSPLEGEWQMTLDGTAYREGVRSIRRHVAAGDVYQVNLCRVMSHPLPEDADLEALAGLLAAGNPAPHAALIRVPGAGLEVACASPELFLSRRGDRLESRPIKGTAPAAGQMLAKDYAENVMIADLVRNDLSHVCREGTVRVDALCATEEHPGLAHLVTTVSGSLRPGVTWPQIAAATLPPGSVSGAPKSSALAAIAALEPGPRGPYCGAVGWVDADRDEADLAVGIRTFWAERDAAGQRWLRFGTGAGITWGSDPEQEWEETRLKAARLIGLASGRVKA
ncbi:chorismate-binding protein [Oryzihumus leptocrescens]|uniref:chorismate-binding protein n=1 Tax=Oryzihumus leptocrescens TaxID=297536 RepID=UPI001FE87712|nr:chorismate-binding protein [Oryzihumus leptocrescens]